MITIHIIIINSESQRMTKSVPMEAGVCLHKVHMVLTSIKCPGDAKWPEWPLHICGSLSGGPGGLTALQKPHPTTHTWPAFALGETRWWRLSVNMFLGQPLLSFSSGHSSSTFIMSIICQAWGLALKNKRPAINRAEPSLPWVHETVKWV